MKLLARNFLGSRLVDLAPCRLAVAARYSTGPMRHSIHPYGDKIRFDGRWYDVSLGSLV